MLVALLTLVFSLRPAVVRFARHLRGTLACRGVVRRPSAGWGGNWLIGLKVHSEGLAQPVAATEDGLLAMRAHLLPFTPMEEETPPPACFLREETSPSHVLFRADWMQATAQGKR